MSEMDQNYRFSASGMSNALFPVSPDRTNQQRPQHSRESSVTDQVHKFNSMASISRTAERGVNDAALKRAMMAREEAQSEARKYRLENESLQGIESDMRRYREEAAQYNREVKIISERYENLVVGYPLFSASYTISHFTGTIHGREREPLSRQGQVGRIQGKLYPTLCYYNC